MPRDLFQERPTGGGKDLFQERNIAPSDPMDMGLGEALVAAARATPGAVVQAAKDTAKMVDDWGRTIAGGMTVGYADEIAAGADTAIASGIQAVLPEGAAQATNEFLGISPDFQTNYARETERGESIPATQQIAGEVIGGLTALPAAGARTVALGTRYAPQLMRQAGNLASRTPLWARIPATGGGIGAAYGSGAAQPGERLEGAMTGGALGAVAAPAAYYGMRMAGEGASRLYQGIQNRLQPGTAAQRQVVQAFTKDAVRPGQARVNLTRMGPQATLADVGGENVVTLARRAASEPGVARNQAMQVYRDRAIGEGQRILADVQEGLGKGNYYLSEEQMLQTLRNNADGLYREAYRAGRQLESNNLDRILRRPIMQDAMKEAADLAQIEGRRVSPLAPELTAQAREAVELGLMPASAVPKGGIGRGISTEAIDDLKRGLDVLIAREKNELTGKLNKRGQAITNLKNELLREVDRLNPAYRQARRVYSGDAETLEALRLGREALKQDPEIISRTLQGLSEASQEAYRTGAARAITDLVRKTPDTTSAANRLGSRGFTRDQLQAIFPDAKSYNRMINTLETEMRFQGVRNTITGGSPTARIQADQRNWGGGILQDILNNPGGLAQGLAKAGVERLGSPNPLVADELAQILMTQGGRANRQTLNQLMALGRQRQGQSLAVQGLERALANASAQQIGTAAGRF